MEYKENGTKLLIEVIGEGNAKIEDYSISNGSGLMLNLQVSGEIQSFDEVEIGLYTNENAPLCPFGPFVITRVSVSRFLMAMGMISVGVYNPKHQSKFAHVSFWTEDNTAKGVELDLKETLKFWKDHLPDKQSLELKLMLSGYSSNNKKNFMRDIKVVNLIQ